MEPARVRTLLSHLAKSPRATDLLGAETHGFRLNPSVAADRVREFEQRWSVQLPDDYRSFLIDLGNGGAGPGYGVFPLGEMMNASNALPVPVAMVEKETERMLSVLHEPFVPVDDDWDLAQPIPGAVPVSHLGCASYDYLVLNGSNRGQIWSEAATPRRLSRIHHGTSAVMTFGTWYEDWLVHSCRQCRIPFD